MKKQLSEAIAARMSVLAGIPLVEGGPYSQYNAAEYGEGELEKDPAAADYEEENLGDAAWNDGSDEDLSDTGLETQGMHTEDIGGTCPQCGEAMGDCECEPEEMGMYAEPMGHEEEETLIEPDEESVEDVMADVIDSDIDYEEEPAVVFGRSIGESAHKRSKKIRITESQLRSLIRAIKSR